jgi:tyrosyl-tRNA synthetase
MDEIEEVLTRGVENVLPDKSGLAKLMAGKKIRVYLGIDPTGPKLHLGHTIPLRKLQQFADLGHQAILLFGTGTVLAGDPSQRKEARKAITQEEINENIKNWKIQAAKVVDLEKIQIKQNGDWLLKLTVPEVINIASKISAIQLFKREMFQKRMEAEETVWTHELLYPLLQGYDSVHLDTDAEIGGTDQTFNMLIGRELQKKMKNREKFVVTTPLILGTDGQIMSKSSDNCIWLDDSAQDMYGKIMSMSDNQIEEYWTNLTDMPQGKLKSAKPFDAKKQLACKIVKIYHGQKAAEEAEQEFESTFQKGTGFTSQITFSRGATIADIALTGSLVESKSELKRLLAEGAIDLDNKTVTDINAQPKDGQILKLGKKRVIKLQEEK